MAHQHNGDQARELIAKSDGVKRTMQMATQYCQAAIDQVSKYDSPLLTLPLSRSPLTSLTCRLPPSDARAALVDLAYKVIVRSK